MRRCSSKEREQFVSLIERHANDSGEFHHSKLYLAQALMRYGATLGGIAERQCNGYSKPDYFHAGAHVYDDKAERRDQNKEERIKRKVKELCAMFSCKPMFSGDPRGNVLKIQVPSGYTNDWGREGICVPTS